MTKRDTVTEQHVGKKVVFTVQGDGNVIDVIGKDGKPVLSTIAGQEGTILQKRIYNLKANSGLAMTNPRNRTYMVDALKAEKAGKADAASEGFNQYLNACQLSFGVLLPSAIVDQLSNGVDIAAKVIKVDTDNGSLLTIDPSTISVKQPEYLETGTSFNINSFLAEEDDVPANETAAQKRARLAGAKK